MKRPAAILYAGFVVALIASALASSAEAASKFLSSGALIVGELPIKMEGLEELLLEVMEGLPHSIDILCSPIFDGVIGAGGESGTLNELLMLTGVLLTESVLNLAKEEVVGDDLECVDNEKICEGNVLVVAINMPWKWSVELAGTTYTMHILNAAEAGGGKEPGYAIDCFILGILTEDLCEGLTAAVLENAEGGVLAEFSGNEQLTPAMTCTPGTGITLLLSGSMIITDSVSGLLTVSE